MKTGEKNSYDNPRSAIKFGNLELPKGYTIPEHHGHRDSFTTIREGTHHGKTIRIETTYRIVIDDEPLTTHTFVLNDGSVHCHALPNYSFRSAMDLARKLIDGSQVEIPENELSAGDSNHHGGHH